MRQRIINSVIAIFLLATLPVWGQTTVIRRSPSQTNSKTKPPTWFGTGSDFSEGLSCVMNYDCKFGFVNKNGTAVIPYKWKHAGSFSEGLAWVVDDNGKYGFIDKTGKVVIPVKWREMPNRTEIEWGFSDGLAWVIDDNNQKSHIINKQGQIVK